MKEVIRELLTYAVEVAVLTVLGFAVHYLRSVVVPFLKEKSLYTFIEKAVKAAEKLGEIETLKDGEAKKSYVLSVLKHHGITYDQTVNTIIEAAVKELDIEERS